MVNPTIYTACIEQFWANAKVKTVNGEVQIEAIVDKKKVIIIETSIRRDLQLADENGYELPPSLLCQTIQLFRRHASHTELFDQEVESFSRQRFSKDVSQLVFSPDKV
ncbi:hypothetical protein Tco_1090821 [Tanacetum coccineum]|uniref:Uncharacterized protein n=1 Tax=Tanacetum coccineum TaxID=301880 RepID=A0ABQ5I7D6_9ASTR